MVAKIMNSRTDHTPEALRELAVRRKFQDCRHRLRAVALVIEDELSRTGIAHQWHSVSQMGSAKNFPSGAMNENG